MFFTISKPVAITCLVLGIIARAFYTIITWDNRIIKKDKDKFLVINGQENNNSYH